MQPSKSKTDGLNHAVSSPPISWCAVGIQGQYDLPGHLGGYCTLVVVEEIPLFHVKCFEYLEKHYINVLNSLNHWV